MRLNLEVLAQPKSVGQERLYLLDWGRFLAALSVIAFHWLFNGINNGKISSVTYFEPIKDITKYGFLGVEFFFVISGVVIIHSMGDRPALLFMKARCKRLFPMFWFAVFFTSAFAIFWGGEKMGITLSQFLINLTMFPWVFDTPPVDGVYWTLFYEWKFYFLIFAILTTRLRGLMELFFILWPFYIGAANYLNIDKAPYTNPCYIYFSAGALLAISARLKLKTILPSLSLCGWLCVHYATAKLPELSLAKGVPYSPYIVGTIIALMLLFIFCCCHIDWCKKKMSGAELAGALTYPMYLIHAHFGYMIISRFANNNNKLLIYLLTFGFVLGLSWLANRLISIALKRPIDNLFDAIFKHLSPHGFKSSR